MSSVHWPGCSRCGPPPTMSTIGSNEPGRLNSSVVPSASPAASPNRLPRNRSRVAVSLTRRPPETVRSSSGRTYAAVLSVASGGGGTSSPFPATTARSGPEPRLRSCRGARASSQPASGLLPTPRARILARRETARINPIGVRHRPIASTRCAHHVHPWHAQRFIGPSLHGLRRGSFRASRLEC